MVRRLPIFLGLVGAVLGLPSPQVAFPQFGLYSSLAKFRLGDAPSSFPQTLGLLSARNEWVSFQVYIAGPATSVSVSVAGWASTSDVLPHFSEGNGSNGRVDAVRPRATVYAARYVNVTVAAGCLGATGMWPDPLVPDVDDMVGQKRNAFPLDVAEGATQAVWVDVWVPETTAPGNYTTSVTVSHSTARHDSTSVKRATESTTLSVSLDVLSFALPSTPSLKSIFGFGGGRRLAAAHKLADPDNAEGATLVRRYIAAGAAHRVTLADWIGSNASSPDVIGAGNTSGRFDAWAVEHGELYSGFDVPGPEGSPSILNTSLTSVQLPTPFCSLGANRSGFVRNCTEDTVEEQIGFWRSMAEAFRSRGWGHLLYDYTIDEPNAFAESAKHVAWDVIRERVGWLREADSSLPALVTTELNEATAGDVEDLIDIWVPIVNDINPKSFQTGEGWELCSVPAVHCEVNSSVPPPNCTSADTRPQYDPVVARTGAVVWMYMACPSYGCGPTARCKTTTHCDLGWPSYAIDHTAAINRAMEWASYIERAAGELYYSTTTTYKGGPDGMFGWGEALFYGGSGDGYLFYPGVASDRVPWNIGGSTDIPIASIRFKHARDGFEDNEWLRILERLTDRETVLRTIEPFMKNAWTFDQGTAEGCDALESVRRAVGNAIEARLATTSSHTPSAA